MRIGIGNSPAAQWRGAHTQSLLAEQGIPCELVTFDAAEGSALVATLEAALLRGEVDVAAQDMRHLPVSPSDTLALTAVSARETSAECLLFQEDSLEKGKIFGLRQQAVIGVWSDIEGRQMFDFRPDLRVEIVETDVLSAFHRISSCSLDALILAAADVRLFDLPMDGLGYRNILPSELMPTPGQGVTAWQCLRQDTVTRLIFKKIHNPDVSAATNVERGLMRLLQGVPLAAYCERDARGSCHAFAAAWIQGGLRRARVSSATFVGLDEALHSQLQA
jgi:porphobilinogen deaminase